MTDAILTVEEATEVRAKELLERREDMAWVLSSRQGRRWAWRLLEQCGVYRMTFAGEATHASAFNEGQRNVGLRLLSDITQHAPHLYRLMIAENTAETPQE